MTQGVQLTSSFILWYYRVANKKRPEFCSDIVLLNNRIQTKIIFLKSKIIVEQYQKLWRFCFDSKICKKIGCTQARL